MKHLLIAAVLAAALPAGAQTAEWLVSPAEALQYKGAEGFDAPRALGTRNTTPVIELLQPQGQKLKAPFPIELRFKPQADAAIVPSTFKVLYGALNFDITQRIAKFAQVTPQGVSFDKAQVPPGKHKLVLQVQDEKQRTGERELRIEVE
jgi:hypothetical protein